jgi:predicted phosphodiesterase
VVLTETRFRTIVPPGWDNLRIVVISDTHCMHDALPDLGSGDILIHCGDWTNIGHPAREMAPFLAWFASQDFPVRVIVAGNHEVTLCPRHRSVTEQVFGPHDPRSRPFEEAERLMAQFEDDIVWLHNESLLFDVPGGGHIHIYGTSQISGGDDDVGSSWGFFDHTDSWDHVPDDVDILVTHVPPLNVRDNHLGRCLGSAGLLHYVARAKPRVHVFGHIHSGYGMHKSPDTLFVNAAITTDEFDLDTNAPLRNAPVVLQCGSTWHRTEIERVAE